MIFWCNKLRLFHYKIVRGILMTNDKVSRILTQQLTLCTFCNNATETICHLFWLCPIVADFIQLINNRIVNDYPLYYSTWNKRNFIFSAKARNILNPQNIFALYLKYYIWLQRCYKKPLNMVGFKNYFNSEINLTKAAFRGNAMADRLLLID